MDEWKKEKKRKRKSLKYGLTRVLQSLIFPVGFSRNPRERSCAKSRGYLLKILASRVLEDPASTVRFLCHRRKVLDKKSIAISGRSSKNLQNYRKRVETSIGVIQFRFSPILDNEVIEYYVFNYSTIILHENSSLLTNF